MALSGMWLTNRNIELFEVIDLSANMVFAKQENQLQIQYQNLNLKSFIWDIEILIENNKSKNLHQIEELISGKIPRRSYITWSPAKRGLQQSPRLLIQSRFPFRMLRAWKYFQQESEFIIYPERKGLNQIPSPKILPNTDAKNNIQDNKGLFLDHREFQKTDSPKKIDWKVSLKHQKHFVKNFETGEEKKILIDWNMTNQILDFEDKISQLALWIDISHKKSEHYSLKINQDQTNYECNDSHYKKCMEKLALLQLADTL